MSWLTNFFGNFGNAVESFSVAAVSAILGIINKFVGILASILPGSPLRPFIDSLDLSGWETGLGWLNWLVPVGFILEVLSAWLAAYVIYLLYSVIMRWAKMIK